MLNIRNIYNHQHIIFPFFITSFQVFHSFPKLSASFHL